MTNPTITTTDALRLLLIVLQRLEQMTAIARTLQRELGAAEAERDALRAQREKEHAR